MVCHFFSVNPVNDFLQLVVAAGLETDLTIHNKFNRNIRMGKCQMLHQICHIASFRLWLLQELAPRRYIVKQIPYKERRPLRCTNLTELALGTALDLIMHAGKILLRLRNQLHLGYGTDTG